MTKEVGTTEEVQMKRAEKELENSNDVEQMENMFANFDPMLGKEHASGASSSQEPGRHFFHLLFFFQRHFFPVFSVYLFFFQV